MSGIGKIKKKNAMEFFLRSSFFLNIASDTKKTTKSNNIHIFSAKLPNVSYSELEYSKHSCMS